MDHYNRDHARKESADGREIAKIAMMPKSP